MAAIDESVVNLQRFLGLVAQATGALEQVGTHVQASAQRFTDLQDEASEDGGGLNDELVELASALESGRDSVQEALTDLTQAAADGQEAAEEGRGRVERAATDLEETVNDTLDELGHAHSSATDQGFQPLLQTIDEAQHELETQSQETEQAFEALGNTIQQNATESQAAWDAVEAHLEESVSALSQGEGAIESEAAEGVHGFVSAGDELGVACSTLESEVDMIYDVLDSAVSDQGQEWDQALSEYAREALDHVGTSAEDSLVQPAQTVEEEALASLGREYTDLEAVLVVGAAVGDETEPLSAELAKCGAVIGQVDELLNSLAG